MSLEKIDIDLWKEIQDKFSEQIGLPIITLDSNQKELAVSGEFPFISRLIRSKRPDLYHKPNGLINISKPLILYGQEVGKIICGPINIDPEFNFKDIAERLGIEKEELIDAANEITKLNRSEVELYSKFISLLANIIPKLAYQTKKKDNEITELTTLYNIIKKVNSSLELKDILKQIMNFLTDSLDAGDCSVIVQNEDSRKRYFLKHNNEQINLIESSISKKAINDKKPIIINDIKKRFNIKNTIYNSIISFPLRSKDNIIGTLNLFDFPIIDEEKIRFISIISDQVAIAIDNAQKYEIVKELAVIDKLTGLFNRRYFIEMFENELNRKINSENPIALILIDIDHFGKYNNAHGHPKGDTLLKELGTLLKHNTRSGDLVGRYGGEEFIILLPRTKPNQAKDIAERIRKSVEEYPFEGRETQPGGKVTLSIGLVICMDNLDKSDLIKEADRSLYAAKTNGRNQVKERIIVKNNLMI